MDHRDFVWLAANYHFPLTYSCRAPLSSPNSALAMPAPGPATVRLAMVRTGLELFGESYVRDELFPVLRTAEIHIQPPARVAISTQLFRAYKASKSEAGDYLATSLIYREVCQAEGVMTVYLKTPATYEAPCRETLEAIGYWGQANSLTWCTGVSHTLPQIGEYGIPLTELIAARPLQKFFCCLVSEFRDPAVAWDEIMPVLKERETKAIRLQVWVWPLVISKQWSNHKLLVGCSLR
jgi:hypothetical protein